MLATGALVKGRQQLRILPRPARLRNTPENLEPVRREFVPVPLEEDRERVALLLQRQQARHLRVIALTEPLEPRWVQPEISGVDELVYLQPVLLPPEHLSAALDVRELLAVVELRGVRERRLAPLYAILAQHIRALPTAREAAATLLDHPPPIRNLIEERVDALFRDSAVLPLPLIYAIHTQPVLRC
jgi:hypothetical protein